MANRYSRDQDNQDYQEIYLEYDLLSHYVTASATRHYHYEIVKGEEQDVDKRYTSKRVFSTL